MRIHRSHGCLIIRDVFQYRRGKRNECAGWLQSLEDGRHPPTCHLNMHVNSYTVCKHMYRFYVSHRQTNKQARKQTNKETHTQNKQTNKLTNNHTSNHSSKRASEQASKRASEQTNKQTNKQTSIQTHKDT